MIFADYRSVRFNFFHENLSKCTLFPVAQRMPQQAPNQLCATGIKVQTKEVLKIKNLDLTDGKLVNWLPRHHLDFGKESLKADGAYCITNDFIFYCKKGKLRIQKSANSRRLLIVSLGPRLL